MSSQNICIVTAGGPYAWIIFNALGGQFGPIDVVIEEPEGRWDFLSRRARKVGWWSTLGQFATMIVIKLGKKIFATRIERIDMEEAADPRENPQHRVTHVPSINSEEFIRTLDRLHPSVILLVGCRLMKREILARLDVPGLNFHPGITPQYRGMNGGYWALANADSANFGSTVHLVDPGIDTGDVLYQARGTPGPRDNLMTYTRRQTAQGRAVCIAAVQDALQGRLRPTSSRGGSRQWYHPTIWQYVWTGLTRGVW